MTPVLVPPVAGYLEWSAVSWQVLPNTFWEKVLLETKKALLLKSSIELGGILVKVGMATIQNIVSRCWPFLGLIWQYEVMQTCTQVTPWLMGFILGQRYTADKVLVFCLGNKKMAGDNAVIVSQAAPKLAPSFYRQLLWKKDLGKNSFRLDPSELLWEKFRTLSFFRKAELIIINTRTNSHITANKR